MPARRLLGYSVIRLQCVGWKWEIAYAREINTDMPISTAYVDDFLVR
jgi:hypothetical protein